MYSFKYMKSSSTKFKPNNMIQESRKNYGYVSGFNYIHLRINLPKACNLNSRTKPKFYLTFSQIYTIINLPKACDPRSQTRQRFCLTLSQIHARVNLLKACDPRSRIRPRFYLALAKFTQELIPMINFRKPSIKHQAERVWMESKILLIIISTQIVYIP